MPRVRPLHVDLFRGMTTPLWRQVPASHLCASSPNPPPPRAVCAKRVQPCRFTASFLSLHHGHSRKLNDGKGTRLAPISRGPQATSSRPGVPWSRHSYSKPHFRPLVIRDIAIDASSYNPTATTSHSASPLEAAIPVHDA